MEHEQLPPVVEILKGEKGDALALLITFILTVLIDLTVAVQVGVVLSAIVFLKRMTDKTTLQSYPVLLQENLQGIPSNIAIFEINGPFFYTVSHLLDEALIRLETSPKVFILCMQQTPLIDSTGFRALKQFNLKCQQKNIAFLIAGAKPELFRKSDIEEVVGKKHIFPTVDAALASAYRMACTANFSRLIVFQINQSHVKC